MMSYSKQDLIELKEFYKNQLLNDTIPFWFPRSFDTDNGGFLLMRNADGSLIDDDKAVTAMKLMNLLLLKVAC